MFPDNEQFKEATHIGEELFDDQAYELDRRCRSVQRGVERNLFARETALKSYGVTRQQYEDYLSRNLTEHLQSSISINYIVTSLDYGYFIHVMDRMLQNLAKIPHHGRLKHLDSTINEMKKLSKEVEHSSFQMDE